ncbi:hypothetical protein [Halorubrum laminariae]|uniref:Uncharacterized protein n=1 Tax=Halorubrum laminariae TaxID=1433523 RepID=A0ABD6BZD2_9EURY|nr:hypothetical protein [Halorubrum laminariae]
MPILSADELKDRGWEDPLDESPIDTPDGWFRGAVVHTGGHIFCRIWSTRDEVGDRGPDEPDTYFEAVYGSGFQGVDIDRYEYNEDHSEWRYEGNVVSAVAEEQTDEACAELAAELMEDQDVPS